MQDGRLKQPAALMTSSRVMQNPDIEQATATCKLKTGC